jgi:uncharacterized delta-60 repeat protein
MFCTIDSLKLPRRLVLVGLTTAALLSCLSNSGNVQAIPAQIPGDLDMSFASGTGVISNFTVSPFGSSQATAMALQSDGKIVLAGYCDGPNSQDFCVVRLNPDGSQDASFVGPLGNGNGAMLLDVGGNNDTANAVAIQPDGKILVAGSCHNGANNDFCIARLNPNGSLDATFDGPSGTGNGQVMLPIGSSDDFATAMALQPDGKIVLVGNCVVSNQNDFCAARLNVDGSFDTSFVGPNGTAAGKFTFPMGISNDYATAVALQSDGMIVIAGRCVSPMVDFDFCITRLTGVGAFDTTFDGPGGSSNGKFLLPISSSNDLLSALLIQPDGKILLAGSCLVGIANNDFCVARLLADGSFDSTFDGPSGTGDGKILLPITASKSDNATALALQPDGKILLGGHCDSGTNEDFCLARLHIDGSLDQSFDGPGGTGNGKFLLPIGASNNVAGAMLLQPDGKIVIGGYCDIGGGSNQFCLARLYGGPFGYKNCSMDIDGDGKVLPTTDGLLLTRIALGFTGAAVLSGAQGVGATRNTWPKVRDYLVNQCGMSVAP